MSTWILQIPHRHPKNKKPMMNSSPGSIKIATSWLVQSSAIQKIIWPLASNTVDAELEKTPVGLVCPATLLLAPQSMNLESFINVGTMPGLTHGIQLLPVAFDQIMTSRGYQRSLSHCPSFITSPTTQRRTTSLPNKCWRRLPC